jgi:hypothetical protein
VHLWIVCDSGLRVHPTVSMTIVDKSLRLGHDGRLLEETHAGL